MTVVVETAEDLKKLKHGQAFVILPKGLPDDPEELLESDAWAEAQKIRETAEKLFSEPSKEDSDRLNSEPDENDKLNQGQEKKAERG